MYTDTQFDDVVDDFRGSLLGREEKRWWEMDVWERMMNYGDAIDVRVGLLDSCEWTEKKK